MKTTLKPKRLRNRIDHAIELRQDVRRRLNQCIAATCPGSERPLQEVEVMVREVADHIHRENQP